MSINFVNLWDHQMQEAFFSGILPQKPEPEHHNMLFIVSFC